MYPTIQKYINEYNRNYKTGLIIILVVSLLAILLMFIEDYLILPIFFLLVMAIITIKIKKAYNKYQNIIASLDEETKKEIEKELNNPIAISKNNYTITKNMIFIPNIFEAIKYSDILLVYERPRLSRHSIDIYIAIITKNGKVHYLPEATTAITINYELYDLKETIVDNNCNVLVGKSKENIKILKEKYNINF